MTEEPTKANPEAARQEFAYQLAIKVYLAGLNGEPMPEVDKVHKPGCEALWQQARHRARIND